MAEIETTVTPENAEAPVVENAAPPVEEPAQESELVAKLRAEMARQKAALDKATKEAAESRKALRAKQSAEEIAAEEKRLQDEARDNELAELRKRFAVVEMSKKIMSFIGDETAATSAAEYFYGSEDADAGIDVIQKAWIAREKALRLEFGKVPAPSAGAAEGTPMTKAEIMAIRDPAERQKKIAENYSLFVKG